MKYEGFILGLTNGVACIAACAPVLMPYLMGEGKGIARNYWLTGQFLAGRLIGYLVLACATWTISRSILQAAGPRNIIIGVAYIIFSVLLIIYGFFRKEEKNCPAAGAKRPYQRLLASWPALLPVAAGLATGLSFCPPMLLAMAGAAEQPNLAMSLLFFFSFFLGTSLLFVLAPLVGVFKRFSVLQIIGKLAAGLMGLYYLYSGIIMLVGGLKL